MKEGLILSSHKLSKWMLMRRFLVALADKASEIMTTFEQSRRDQDNNDRQQRLRNRNGKKSNDEIAAVKQKLKDKLLLRLGLSSSESESSLGPQAVDDDGLNLESIVNEIIIIC